MCALNRIHNIMTHIPLPLCFDKQEHLTPTVALMREASSVSRFSQASVERNCKHNHSLDSRSIPAFPMATASPPPQVFLTTGGSFKTEVKGRIWMDRLIGHFWIFHLQCLNTCRHWRPSPVVRVRGDKSLRKPSGQVQSPSSQLAHQPELLNGG